MTDDASLTDFLDDAGSDEGGDADETGERADDPATGGEPRDRDASDAVDDDTPTDDSGDRSADDTDPESGDARVPPETVEPATVTAAWSPDGVACDDCGSVVAYRWTGEAGLVCPDCKEW